MEGVSSKTARDKTKRDKAGNNKGEIVLKRKREREREEMRH